MIKKLFLVSLVASVSAMAADNYSALAGNWEGTVTKNQKDVSAGGSPTMDTEKTPVKIELKSAKKGVEGTSTVGGSSETWTFNGKQYTWKDSDMEVTATMVKDMPDWVKKEVNLKPADKVFAFKFEDCKLVKDGKVTGEKCKVKEHMPQGMDTTGHWVFKVEGKTMKTSVLYKYPSGNVRHLEEVLAKK